VKNGQVSNVTNLKVIPSYYDLAQAENRHDDRVAVE